ncbi:MAG: hypothetical protein ACF8Q5_09720 [Phycisphaerales bacterium JB040]
MARGPRKNLLLTLWLIAPIAVVTLLCVWIFTSFERGPAMNAPGRGVGAEDTGGANALGEWLAGRDPDEVQRINRDLREGRLIDPMKWDAGIDIRITVPAGADFQMLHFSPSSSTGKAPGPTIENLSDTEVLVHLTREGFEERLVYFPALGEATIGIVDGEPVATLADGTPIQAMVFGPISADRVPSDNTRPIEFELDLTEQAESGG